MKNLTATAMVARLYLALTALVGFVPSESDRQVDAWWLRALWDTFADEGDEFYGVWTRGEA